MYASLIGSGASQLYNLLQSQIQPGSSSGSTSSASGVAGSSFDNDLNQLFLDMQSKSSTSTSSTSPTSATSTSATSTGATSTTSSDPTDTIANDLQNAFNDLQKAGGGHHHHHHGASASASQTDPTSAASTSSSSTASTSNPFDNLASSLLAYVNTQGLTSSPTSSTSLTA